MTDDTFGDKDSIGLQQPAATTLSSGGELQRVT